MFDRKYTESNGEFYAGKFMDLANLGAAALVFNQAYKSRFSLVVFVLGIGLFLACIIVSYWLRNPE